MCDEIVEEVRKIRQAHAERFGYDLDAIVPDLPRDLTLSAASYSVIEENTACQTTINLTNPRRIRNSRARRTPALPPK